jgi:hypothetical protein
LQWKFHVLSHSDVSSHNWKVHRWRQVMNHEGIRQEYSDFLVYSDVNFTTELLNVQDLCQACTISLKVVQQ